MLTKINDDIWHIHSSFIPKRAKYQRPLLLTWIHFNPSMDKPYLPQINVEWNYLYIPKLQWLHRWSLGMDKWFHPTLYNGRNYLSMLGLKLKHVSKRGPRAHHVPSADNPSLIKQPDSKWIWSKFSSKFNIIWLKKKHHLGSHTSKKFWICEALSIIKVTLTRSPQGTWPYQCFHRHRPPWGVFWSICLWCRCWCPYWWRLAGCLCLRASLPRLCWRTFSPGDGGTTQSHPTKEVSTN